MSTLPTSTWSWSHGSFSRYRDEEVELVGYTTCDGCPGGNVEYAPAEMKKNGAEVVHLATGLLVGYPPCPYIDDFQKFIEEKYGMEVVLGTHPIPRNYYETIRRSAHGVDLSGKQDLRKPSPTKRSGRVTTDRWTRRIFSGLYRSM